MQLGFVTAILPELSFEEVLSFAASTGYKCVEVMCWPVGKAERRYAGVTHIDVTDMKADAAAKIGELVNKHGVAISGLGYYPNPLTADRQEAETYINHLRNVIKAAALLKLGVVNTFIGRDPKLTVDENWPRFLEVWKPLVKFAEDNGVKIGIENCPMFFTRDEWPGGKNLATTPKIWRRMFDEIGSPNLGLNYDPSHLVWQRMDYIAPIREFAKTRFFHAHAKDARLDVHKLNEVGLLAYPNEYHTPKLPGLGEVDWGAFFAALSGSGYDGAVCVEVEDRAYEGSIEKRKAALVQCYRYLSQFTEA
jgi:sugar phosphate isomerase/epimerase